MPWETKLNGHELNALRKLMMLSTTEAAELIGKVSVRTWERWEAGAVELPDDVDMEMNGLAALREQIIAEIYGLLEDGQEEFPYYHAFEQWVAAGKEANRVQWRLWQSALADLFVNEQEVKLV